MISKYIRLAAIINESVSNGPGLRRVIFSQGCRHNCKGCFNPHTHDFNCGELMDMNEIISGIKSNPILRGVTFSGGDPFEQADKFAYLAEEIHKLNKNVWCYTGYTYEYIIKNKNLKTGWNDLINNIDVLVDGRFEENLKSPSLKYKGSSNQRIIDVKESLKSQSIVVIG